MAGLIPIPTSRVSNYLIRQRLLSQLQNDQLDLFKLQNQVSTGRRIFLPSDDAPAAQRAITLQRLLERKTQLQSNVETGSSFLAATDVALDDIASDLGDIRGLALAAVSTTETEGGRQSTISAVNGVINSLLTVANTQFRGRYLFAGSQTNVKPYSYDGTFVEYHGNSKNANAFSDLGVLFSTNAPGAEVFGGVSPHVLGTGNLRPHVSADTLLSSLRDGRGISPDGALQISDGTNTVVVDISRAVTVGDVARLIEASPPLGRKVSATVTGTGLTLQINGGNLTVNEVGSGKVASELGILEKVGVLTNPLVGDPLEPILLPTTRLNDLLGSKAQARLVSDGENNDLILQAALNGAQYNNVVVQLVDDDLLSAAPGLTAGNESAEYDAAARAARASLRFTGAGNDLIVSAVNSGTAYNNVRIVVTGQTGLGNAANVAYDALNKRLTITVDDAGATTVQAVRNAIDGTGLFVTDDDDSVETYNAAATINPIDVNTLQGDTGNSGGAAGTLYVNIAVGTSTANQVAAAINEQGTFLASIDPLDSTNLSQAGTQTVSVQATATTAGGSGEPIQLAAGLQLTNGGTTYTLDFSTANTVQDFLNVFNGSEAGVVAEINDAGTGVNIRSRLSGADLQIAENGGLLATQIGIRTLTGATRLADLNYGVGVPVNDGNNLSINSRNLRLTARNGTVFDIDLLGVGTIPAAIAAINAVTGASITAQPAVGGAGLTLVDNTLGPANLQLSQSGPPLSLPDAIAAYIPAPDLTISTRNGLSFNVDLDSAVTVNDVLGLINSAGGGSVLARLAVTGNGLEIVDNTVGAGQLTVDAREGSPAAESLGLVAKGATQATSTTGVLTGGDRNYLETPSVFSTLLRLREALVANDVSAMERAIARIDADIDRATFARSDVGARQQALEVSERNLEDEDVQLQSALADEIEVDLVAAITNLTARQLSLQASLQTMGSILQVSLLDFL